MFSLRFLPALVGAFMLVWLSSCSCESCTQCGPECVHLQTDQNHCGSCGNECPRGFDCERGRCLCTEGFSECNDLCVDLSTNVEHCGRCGIECAPGALCSLGRCEMVPVDAGTDAPMDGGGSCDPPRTDCDPDCADLQTDVRHCGACNNRCMSEEICVAGACDCNRCEGVCTDLDSDDMNCGSCGMMCPVDSSCLEGRCLGDRRLEFVLSWDVPGDMDLRVLRPDGVEIYFGNRMPPTGPDGLDGDLDADDTTMTGPERIGFDAPIAGDYTVCVDPFRISTSTRYELRTRESGVEIDSQIGFDTPENPRAQPCTAATSELVYSFTP